MANTTIGPSGVTFPDGTVQSTKAVSGGSGTVTSVATGNGLQGGTITTSGTLSIAAPGFNTVGSYALVYIFNNITWTITAGGSYSAGGGQQQVQSCALGDVTLNSNNLSGTWRWMGAGGSALSGCGGAHSYGVAVRVA